MLTAQQQDMYNQIADYRAERLEGWRVELVNRLPAYTEMEESCYLGTFSMAQFQRRHKFVLAKHAHRTPGGFLTPGEMARDYLKLHYPKYNRKATYGQIKSCIDDRGTVPLYCLPTKGEAVYVDLKAAYWSIVRTVGWNVNYHPERFLVCNPDNEDFPFADNKLGRNMLVSTSLPHNLSMWNGRRVVTVQKRNPYQNLILFRLVTDVLNAIAAEMIQYAGAIYVNTDGYIIPAESYDRARDVLDSWGLPYAIKFQGMATVTAIASYKFPTHTTKRVLRERQTNKIQSVNRQWLKKRFTRRVADVYSTLHAESLPGNGQV